MKTNERIIMLLVSLVALMAVVSCTVEKPPDTPNDNATQTAESEHIAVTEYDSANNDALAYSILKAELENNLELARIEFNNVVECISE